MARTKFRSVHTFSRRNKRKQAKTPLQNAEGLSEPLPVRDEGSIGEHENTSEEPSSSSAKKFDYLGINLEEEIPVPETFPDCSFIAELSAVNSLIEALLCPQCLKPGVKLHVSNKDRLGFALKASLTCSACEESVATNYLCKRVGNSSSSKSPFEVNVLACLSFRQIGCGNAAINDWCSLMNIPCNLSNSSFAEHNHRLEKASSETFKEISASSVVAIFDAYKENGILPDDQGVLDIAVSFDGSWQKRGYSSHNGMAAIIDLLTGLPIDFEVLSNFCLACKLHEKKGEDGQWASSHIEDCCRNFTGSANAMEVECAIRLWSRSVDSFKLRYTTILCDGDSKTYDALSTSDIYGAGHTITKEDCINHVSKRMGTALRNLVASAKANKQSISRKGKLTQELMLKIQNYYGRAIKDHSDDIPTLKKRIFAILFHLSSTDASPKHVQCPPGEKSWCFWQRAKSQQKAPGSHKDHDTLPEDIGKLLVPIFNRLGETELLKRCARAKTQNANESLHNLIWSICPKTTFVSGRTIRTAVSLAVCQFSMGCSFRLVLCRALGISPGNVLKQRSLVKDKLRIKKASKATTAEVKKRRKETKYSKTKKQKTARETEGSTYAAGGFDC